MGYYGSLRSELLDHFIEMQTYCYQAIAASEINPMMLQEAADRAKATGKPVSGPDEILEELHLEAYEFGFAAKILEDAKTILYSAEQARVFVEQAQSYSDGLGYRLPFSDVALRFTRPIDVGEGSHADQLMALLLTQQEITQEVKQQAVHRKKVEKAILGSSPLEIKDLRIGTVVNVAIAVFTDKAIRKITWESEDYNTLFESSDDNSLSRTWAQIKNLAIACIGYINCENVYLHRESVPDKVNRKRERRGKARLEPYYVCRIRGVQYDSQGRPTGEGTAHGYRYDVRGHFRRLESGKVTWVRPHQRGLKHELYIPKTYVVEQGAKQLEQQ